MLILKELATQRNHWYCEVELYKSEPEARAEGFHVLYDDAEGTVYGIKDSVNTNTFKRIAFAPYRIFWEKYKSMAEKIK